MHRRFLYLFALAAITSFSSEAWAGKYDLDLTPLGGENGTLDPDYGAFRSLSSELGVIAAPKPVDPADSLGLSGFAFSADVSLNTIAHNRDYWSATTDGEADPVVPTLQIVGRKGLWPGLEVGAGATHIFDSRLWSLAGYGKLALHEGFHHLPIPSIALRFGGAQLLGSKEIKMTTLTPGVTVSHVFGLGKTVNLTPYIGYEALLILARSTVIDATPNCDEYPDDYNEDQCTSGGGTSEFVFKRQDVIVRHRPHVGARFIFSVIRITAEAMFVPPGNTDSPIDGSVGTMDNAEDGAKFQQQYTLSVGFDF